MILARMHLFLPSIRFKLILFLHTPAPLSLLGGNLYGTQLAELTTIFCVLTAHYSYPQQALERLAVMYCVTGLSVPGDHKILGGRAGLTQVHLTISWEGP